VLDTDDGAVAGTGTTGSTDAKTSAVANGRIHVGTTAGTVKAFAAAGCGTATCAPLWNGTTAGPSAPASVVTGGPVVTNGRVYVGTLNGTVVAFALPPPA
jgi:outer membrane protein assembly factor BamB